MREEQIRPTELFQEFIRLTARDAEHFFARESFVRVYCPLCVGKSKNPNAKIMFTKFGFEYSECDGCKSWFASYRPNSEAIASWYSDSPGARFWATDFYPVTAEARRELLWRPKAKKLANDFGAQLGAQYSLVDIGGGYGIFAEEFRKISGSRVTVIEPGVNLASQCALQGIPVVPKFLEQVTEADLPIGPKAFVCFELFEHLADPALFFRHLKALMQPNDLGYFTTLSSQGVDIQELGSISDAVSPPHHLLFANPASVATFLDSMDFESVEISTPGKLDVDILFKRRNHLEAGFWRDFLLAAGEEQRLRMQELITATGLSSHMSFLFKIRV